jgi:hypothetical protein
MKTLATLLTAAALTISSFATEKTKEYSNDARYGFAVSQNHSGSGHGSNVTLNTNVRKGNKSLELGAIYRAEENKVAGADVKYKVFFGTPSEFVFQNKKVRTYFQYNCIYQQKAVQDAVSGTLKSADNAAVSGESKVSTIEHYAGFGLQVKVMNRVHLEGSVGAGGYIGSLKSASQSPVVEPMEKNGGYTVSFKLGLGFTL